MDVIIIGAGAAGLMAARKLSRSGLKVMVLEARDRLGGRIMTLSNGVNDHSMEGGAEFIHGNLDVTLELLDEAGLDKNELTGEVLQVSGGKWKEENDFFENAEVVIEKLKLVEEDISIERFIQENFAEEKYEKLRESLKSYVEGYYSGEVERTSAKSFLEEWMSEDDQQYRPAEGYGKMITYLETECKKAGTIIQLSTVVKQVRWTKGQVEIIDETGHNYIASKLVVTVPLGVWVAEEMETGSIEYIPELPRKKDAAKQMGFGAVTKVLLQFKDAFWESEEIKRRTGKNTDNLHMLLSDQEIPTWWTQFPVRSTLLTGWLSGPKAAAIKDEAVEAVLQKALLSLATIFAIDKTNLEDKLQWWKVINWTADPFTRGSYSYSTMETLRARKILMEPVEETLFFAGEALYEGPEMGTVEAALTSGIKTAEIILEGMV